ncbi:MAG: nucleotide exchange factor GrpE [Actinomycetota bacterium]
MKKERGVPIKVKVEDKRHTATPDEARRDRDPSSAERDLDASVGQTDDEAAEEVEILESQRGHDYLADLQRLQAEFDNYRKRMMKDQSAAAARATARLIENLLPVLDNFERAIAHGEGGAGVELVFKELGSVLEREGLKEVPGEGSVFDPQIHEAVETRDEEGVSEPVVRTVYRRGYSFKDLLVRPAMVIVARPPENGARENAADGGA